MIPLREPGDGDDDVDDEIDVSYDDEDMTSDENNEVFVALKWCCGFADAFRWLCSGLLSLHPACFWKD